MLSGLTCSVDPLMSFVIDDHVNAIGSNEMLLARLTSCSTYAMLARSPLPLQYNCAPASLTLTVWQAQYHCIFGNLSTSHIAEVPSLRLVCLCDKSMSFVPEQDHPQTGFPAVLPCVRTRTHAQS